jgi:two-component system cell cycle response regulator DivK
MAKVLVVEDNLLNLKLAEAILQKAGHTVLTAGDGDAGLNVAVAEQPALILMDIQMPGRDGLAVTRQLKQNPSTAHIKIVALTALAMKGDSERILAAGCDAYLAKPFHYQELTELVERLLA